MKRSVLVWLGLLLLLTSACAAPLAQRKTEVRRPALRPVGGRVTMPTFSVNGGQVTPRTSVARGADLPTDCDLGDLYFKTAAPSAGLKVCNSLDSWSAVGAGGGGGGGAGTTQDDDDGTIAGGQNVDLVAGLTYVHDGTNHKRLTVSAAGSGLSTGLFTIQGNASGTAVPVSLASVPTHAVTQSGAWTMQPGNTANTTAWLVTGTGGIFPSTQSGTWTVQPGNTANTTAWKVDNSAVTQPVSAATRLPVTPQDSGGTSMTDTTAHAAKVLVVDAAGTPISVGVLDPCAGNTKVYTTISQTANTQLVTGTAAKRIYPCLFVILPTADAESISLVAGTGTACATSTVGIIGGASAATGATVSSNGGFVVGTGGFSVAKTTVDADNLCLYQSGSGRVAGVLVSVVQ